MVGMGDEEFNPGVGRISLRREEKKDGTNWVMFADGAIAMAVSVAFGRKKILEEGAEAKETESGCRVQTSQQEDDENGSLQTFETVPNGTSQWRNSQLALPSTEGVFEFRSFNPKRPAPAYPSPPVSKFIRQSSVTPEFSKDEVIQSDSQISSTLQSRVTARRSEIVSRLRQQIKSKDAIIYDMQTQLEDQDQMIAMHHNHSVDLQDCVQAISTKLVEANLEIQRLQRELLTQRAKPIVGLDEEFIDYAVSEIRRQWVHPKDVEEIILEARKLNEEVEHLRREKESKEKIAKAESRQCELLSERLSALTTELEDVKSAAHGKQRLLEAKEQEYLKLGNVVQDLQRKLEIEAREKEIQERSMSMKLIMKRADVRNIKLGHNVDRHIIPTTYEEVPSTLAGNVKKPYEILPVRNGNEESAIRGEPRCLFGGYSKKLEAPGDQDGRVEDPDNNFMIDGSLILKFEYEVDQLASALAVTSKVISEKVQDANGLEQAAKQQDLERGTKDLTKHHQAKLAELKSLMAKITAKFNFPNIEDGAFNKEVLQGAAFLFDLERKLAAKAWRTVQETPRSPFSHNMHQEHAVIGSSDENSRNALPEENPSQFWERQGLPSALRNFNRNRNKITERHPSSPIKLLERPYQFQLGAFDSVAASTSRAHPSVGSRRQSNSVENQPSLRVSF